MVQEGQHNRVYIDVSARLEGADDASCVFAGRLLVVKASVRYQHRAAYPRPVGAGSFFNDTGRKAYAAMSGESVNSFMWYFLINSCSPGASSAYRAPRAATRGSPSDIASTVS